MNKRTWTKRILALALATVMVMGTLPAYAAEVQADIPDRLQDADIIRASTDGSMFLEKLEENYAEPDIEYRTEVRWWIAEGAHSDETLIEEIQAIYDAGFRGLEVCQLNESESTVPSSVYGYGSEQWDHDLRLILNECLDRGMTVSLTAGTNWATANIPGLDPDSEAASQEVGYNYETGVLAGDHYAKELLAPKGGRSEYSLIGAYAYTYEMEQVYDYVTSWFGGGYQYRDVIAIDESSIIDLMPYVDSGDNTIDWAVPANPTGAEYVICTYWQQGAYDSASPSVEPAYCINYFNQKGFDALKAYWEENILNPDTDAELITKIQNGDVQLFMDSLEFSTSQGDYMFWSEDMAAEFQQRKGYDIRPYLCLFIGSPGLTNFDPAPVPFGTFDLQGNEDLRERIRNDLYDVQTELYMENLLTPLKEWLNESYNIKLRAQISYGRYMEISEPGMVVDYPEAETLNQRNQLDIYRLWSGGAHLQNKVLSSETAALGGMAYAYDYQRHMQEAYVQYAAGYSRIIWHIWYAQYGPGEANWPGYISSSWTGGMFYGFGTREPSYSEYTEFNAHLGRVQQLIREGESGTDVGMIYMKYGQNIPFSGTGNWLLEHDTMFFPSTVLQDNGYTYDYFSPEFLNAEDVTFNPETQTLEQAGYKALVLWQDWLTVDGAEIILGMAKQGLKVVIVDGAATRTPYSRGDENSLPSVGESDAELASVMGEFAQLDTVKFISDADDATDALRELGVVPYAGFSEPNHQLLTQVRRDGDDRYLYVYNYCSDEFCTDDHGTSIQTEIEMDGLFIPYGIDAWSGEVLELAEYRYEDGKTVFTIDLDYGDVALCAFEAIDESAETIHIESSGAQMAYVNDTGDALILRAMESGDYEIALSDGMVYENSVQVPGTYEITGWDLTVESWTPGDRVYRTDTFVDSDGNVTVESAVMTNKEYISVTLEDGLKTWDNIPEVGQGVSGKGHYEATFTWDDTSADGAYLDFGDLFQSMQVKINGVKTADVNMNHPVLDISAQLQPGVNTIEIDYSSNLTNLQLSRGVINPATDVGGWQGYHITYRSYGPQAATVVPYVEVEIEIVQRDELQALYDRWADLPQGDYTDDSWAALQGALDEAKAVLDDPNATGAEVDAALKKLQDAVDGLVTNPPVDMEPDKDDLRDLYDEYNEEYRSLNPDDYTADSWAAFEKALEDARAVLDNENATQAEIDAALTALRQAYNGLSGIGQERDTYTVTASANTGGAVTPLTTVGPGEDAEIEIAADEGYKLVAILIDGVTVDLRGVENDVYTIGNVQKDTVLRALFVADQEEDFAAKYTDVPGGQWYYEAVDMLTGLGVVEGVSGDRYAPDKEITRAEFTKLMYALAGVLGVEVEEIDAVSFGDVTADHWAYGFIGWAYETSLVRGYDEETFGPEDDMLRQDMAVFMLRFFDEQQGYDLPGTRTKTFDDADEIGEYAEEAVEYVVRTGLMEGHANGEFGPTETAQRSHVAQVMYNYLIFR